MDISLLSRWHLRADGLDAPQEEPLFSLPGADALAAFAGLLGHEPEDEKTPSGVPFSLPGSLPEAAKERAQLSREIDFSAAQGDRATLVFPLILGRGEVLLGEERLCRFNQQGVTLDVTAALAMRRRQTLTLRFDETRPAGVFGMPLLRVTQLARFQRIAIEPDAKERILRVEASVLADEPGLYALRAAAAPGDDDAPWRETTLSLERGGTGAFSFRLPMTAEPFAAGRPCTGGSLKLELYRRTSNKLPGLLCDTRTLLCGFPGRRPRWYLPLSLAECLREPEALAQELIERHVPAVRLPEGAPELLLAAFTRAGIAALIDQPKRSEERARLLRYPCVSLTDAPPEAPIPDPAQSAAMLCGMTGAPMPPDANSTQAELLSEAAGRRIDPDAPNMAALLAWLRAVRLRFAAEAAAQGRLEGALCAPEEWLLPDAADAIAEALAPSHLSALPLRGAWWTGARFSAQLRLCGPRPAGALLARCRLEDEEGRVLARHEAPIAPDGDAGVISAQLPETPCVLTLCTELMRGEETIERYTLPTYVGERGPLEAAFQ